MAGISRRAGTPDIGWPCFGCSRGIVTNQPAALVGGPGRANGGKARRLTNSGEQAEKSGGAFPLTLPINTKQHSNMESALRIISPQYRHGMDLQKSAKKRTPEPRRFYGSSPLLRSLVQYAEEARERIGEAFSFEAATARLYLDRCEERERTLADYAKLFGWTRQQLRLRLTALEQAVASLTESPVGNQTGTKQEPNRNHGCRKNSQNSPVGNQTGTKQEPNRNQNGGDDKKESFPRTPFKEKNKYQSPLTPQTGGTLSAENFIQEIKIPAHLETPEFRAALAAWVDHRRTLRKPKRGWREFFQAQVDTLLAPVPVAEAVAALRHCAANGYQGLFIRQADLPRKSAETASNGATGFWYVMGYHTALAEAAKAKFDGLPKHWVRFKGADGKPYFVKPEHATRPLPEGLIREEVRA